MTGSRSRSRARAIADPMMPAPSTATVDSALEVAITLSSQ
jgi:hypothetical protein